MTKLEEARKALSKARSLAPGGTDRYLLTAMQTILEILEEKKCTN